MMQSDLNPDEAVRLAAEWLVQEPDHTGRAVIPDLRSRFGLDTAAAIDACRRAQLLRNGGANGRF
jgi:hypothetical protein